MLWSMNFILFIFGLAEIGVGIYVMTSDTTAWTGTFLPNIAIGTGIIVTMIAFLGCCGSAKENRCMLWTYACLLFWIILPQTVGITILFVGNEYTEDFLSSCWNKLSDESKTRIEEKYECCSFNGNSTDATLSDKNAYKLCLEDNPTWTETCWGKAHGDIENNLTSIYVACALVLGAQIIFLFMTMALIHGITVTYVYRRLSGV